jgi:hypothetical protein
LLRRTRRCGGENPRALTSFQCAGEAEEQRGVVGFVRACVPADAAERSRPQLERLHNRVFVVGDGGATVTFRHSFGLHILEGKCHS